MSEQDNTEEKVAVETEDKPETEAGKKTQENSDNKSDKRKHPDDLVREGKDSAINWVLPRVPGRDFSKIKRKIVPKDYDRQAEIKLAKLKAEYDKARKEGYAKGYKEGQEKGLAEYKAKISQSIKLLETLSTNVTATDELVVQQVLDLTRIISEQVIRHELKTNNEVIKELIEEMLRLLPDEVTDVTLLLAPADLEVLQEDYKDFLVKIDKIRLIADKSVAQGGCKLKSRETVIDATIESRMHEILNKIGGPAPPVQPAAESENNPPEPETPDEQ